MITCYSEGGLAGEAYTRIFSRELDRPWLYISISYRGVRCLICTTAHNDAQPIHAKLPQSMIFNLLSNQFTLKPFLSNEFKSLII